VTPALILQRHCPTGRVQKQGATVVHPVWRETLSHSTEAKSTRRHRRLIIVLENGFLYPVRLKKFLPSLFRIFPERHIFVIYDAVGPVILRQLVLFQTVSHNRCLFRDRVACFSSLKGIARLENVLIPGAVIFEASRLQPQTVAKELLHIFLHSLELFGRGHICQLFKPALGNFDVHFGVG